MGSLMGGKISTSANVSRAITNVLKHQRFPGHDDQ
jgi:hypothetical protein